MSVGSWINSGLGPAGKLLRRIPGQAWLAIAGLLLAAFWLAQHDARIRRQARLQQLKQQTSAQVAALKRQAAQEVKQANVENAKAIGRIEARRNAIEQQNRKLAAQLTALREEAQVQAEHVATLPIRDVVNRVAAQLGLQAEDVVGTHTSADIAKTATSAPAMKTATSAPAAGGQSPPLQRPVALPLTDSGARKVETALVALNACRAESSIVNRQIANCQARTQADDAIIRRQAASIASLNQALQANDRILGRQSSECKAELKAARGSFLGRLAHVSEHVAIGVAVGLALGVVVR